MTDFCRLTIFLRHLRGELPRRLDSVSHPLATPYRIASTSQEEGLLAVCRAPGEQQHAPVHAVWKRICTTESRIRHLQGKEVFMMFDVTEAADKLLAGYTVYQPHTRGWPPHNHTDQEEIYIFTKGQGAIEVYADEKSKTFVHSMGRLDAATIPLMNYHPESVAGPAFLDGLLTGKVPMRGFTVDIHIPFPLLNACPRSEALRRPTDCAGFVDRKSRLLHAACAVFVVLWPTPRRDDDVEKDVEKLSHQDI